MCLKTKQLLVALLLASTPGSLAAEPSPPPSESPDGLARQMITLTGGADIAKQVLQRMVEIFRQQNPSVPPEFWEEFVASANTDRLVEITVPIYVQHLTVEEMTAAIEYYSSPAGQSLLKKLPVLVQESMSAGQTWGEELARDIAERIAKQDPSDPGT